jgi:TonB family protein
MLPSAESPGQGKPALPFDLDAYLASGSSEARTSSGVRINLSRIRPTSGKYQFSLKLFVSPEPEAGEVKEEASPGLKSDVYKYTAPRAYEQPGRGLRFSEAGRARPGVPGAMGFEPPAGYRYNIKPWAEKVVSMVQSRWVLPQLAVLPKNKNVALILLVDREGRLLSLEIATSTSSEVLDQAAMTAVRLCAPFPPLPEDFPGKSLEFYLVFTYHD